MAPVRDARFDDSGLVSTAGLVPVMALAQGAGLVEWAGALVDGAGRVPALPLGPRSPRWWPTWSLVPTRSGTWASCGTVR